MTQTSAAGPNASTETTSSVTRALLTGGVVAGPLYVVVSLAQARATRRLFYPLSRP
ncbi:MAG: hypothetical protein ACR2NO_03670 [Chloroflexota bacterium]